MAYTAFAVLGAVILSVIIGAVVYGLQAGGPPGLQAHREFQVRAQLHLAALQLLACPQHRKANMAKWHMNRHWVTSGWDLSVHGLCWGNPWCPS